MIIPGARVSAVREGKSEVGPCARCGFEHQQRRTTLCESCRTLEVTPDDANYKPLPVRWSAVLDARVLELTALEWSHEAIAEELGTTAKSVNNRLVRLRRQQRQAA